MFLHNAILIDYILTLKFEKNILAFQVAVIKKLAKIESNQKEMIALLNTIAVSSTPSVPNNREYFSSLPDFPLASEFQLREFDEYLKNPENFERAVSKYPSLILFKLSNFISLQNIFRRNISH